MNISFDKSKLELALSGIEEEFKAKIIDTFIEVKKRYVKSFFNDEHDTVGLSSGKFCEIVFRFLEKEILGRFTPFDKHISNFPAELNKLSQASASSGNESLRIIIPRALVFIYTLRNKRGIGHVGGEIEANSIDIGAIVKSIDWVVCELVRLYHNLSLDEAQNVVDSLNMKIIPEIWNIDGNKRVIKEGFSYPQKVLLLLYSQTTNTSTLKELFEWCEYSTLSNFKARVIVPLHKEKLIEFNSVTKDVHISPSGIAQAETLLIS